MIFGIGTDITEVSRFRKWVLNPEMILRFFNEKELMNGGTEAAKCQHYAVRFAAKEAFAKAMGTGICGFELKDMYIDKEEGGRPVIKLEKTAKTLFNEKCPGGELFVSLSHEKEYATAFVVIDKR